MLKTQYFKNKSNVIQQKNFMNNINAETYAFLNLQAILEEDHVWCDAILTEVKKTNYAIWIHGLTSEKLKTRVYRKKG